MRPKYSTLPRVQNGLSEHVVATLPPAFMSFANDGCRWTLPGAILDYAYPAYSGAYSFIVAPLAFGQFRNVEDEYGNWLYNIPGDEMFRRLDFAYADDDDSRAGTVVWSYRFDAAAGSVTTLRTVTGDDPEAAPGFESSPTSATHATIMGSDDDGDPVPKGNVTLSLRSGYEFLDETLETYFSQARTWKSGSNGGGISAYYGLATRSHSPGGRRSIVGGSEIYTALTLRGNDIDEQGTPETGDDAVERFGYEAPFRAVTQIVKRRNAPYLTDLGDGSGGVGGVDAAIGENIYRFGTAERKLQGVITDLKWKDPSGLYDRRTPEALAAVGYGSIQHLNLDGLLVGSPAHGIDNSADARFISKDGLSYRLTIKAGTLTYGPSGETLTASNTQTVLVAPGQGSVFAYDTYFPGASVVRITKLEKLVDGIYEDVSIILGTGGFGFGPFIPGTFSSTPESDCRVLVVMRRREGYRWGYPEYTQNGIGSYGDYEAVPYFATQLTTLDFATDTAGLGSVDSGGGGDASDEPPKGRIAGSGGNPPRLAAGGDRPAASNGSTKGSEAAASNGAVTKTGSFGYGTPITSGGAGNGTPLTAGGAGNGTPITSGGAGNGTAITSGGAGRGIPIGSRGDSADFEPDSGAGLQFGSGLQSDYDLGNSRLQFGGGLESNYNLGNSRLQFGRGLQFGGGLQFGRGLQTGGKLGDRRGNSGAILRGGASNIKKGKAVGSGGLGATSGNAGAVSKSNLSGLKGKPLGATSGNSGAISRSNLNGSGGLGTRSGNSGAIKRSGSGGKSLGAKSKVGGGGGKSSGRSKRSRPTPVYVFREFGEPVSGTFQLAKSESFDLKTAKKLPVKVTTWKAMLNGSDWTPELGEDFADRYYNEIIEQEVTATTRGYNQDLDGIATAWSDNCEIRYDLPDRTGRELARETITLTIPNTLESEAWFQDPPTPDYLGPSPSNFHTVKNTERGTTIWPEPLIILP